MKDTQKLGVLATGLLLFAGIATYRFIPFHAINGPGFSQLFGLDLLNVYLFHHCPEAMGNVYGVSGNVCGDPEGRPMLYPPLLFHLFGWVSFLSFPVVVHLWTGMTLTLFGVAGYLLYCAFQNENLALPPIIHGVLWFLFGLQFPMLFTLERATNDAYIFFFFMVGVLLSQKSKWYWVGFLLVGLTAYKIYPAFLVILIAAYSWKTPSFKKLIMALGLFGTVLFVFFWEEHLSYLERVLPQWAAKTASFTVGLDHVILNMNQVVPYMGTAMCLVLLAAGLRLALQGTSHLAVWCYAFAICTFFQNTSFDYNLITTYPLFMLLAALCFQKKEGQETIWALLISGLLVFFVARHLGTFYAGSIKYIAMWLWLVWVGFALTGRPRMFQAEKMAVETGDESKSS